MIRHNGITIVNLRNGGLCVNHRKHRWVFHKPNEKRMWRALLLGGGLTRDRLIDIIYGDDPEGGPLRARNVIDVRLAQWKPRFKALGLRLHKEKRGGQMHLELVPDVV